MRIASAKAISLQIPFVEGFQHSTQNRVASDAILVRVQSDEGVVGWGECLPRPYVTGETVASVMTDLTRNYGPWLSGLEIQSDDLPGWIQKSFPTVNHSTWPVPHAARCAVELALWDVCFKSRGVSISKALPPKRNRVQYGAVLTAGSKDTVRKHAGIIKRIGIKQIKIKVGDVGDIERVQVVREILGEDVQIRADANGVWTLKQAISEIKALESLGVVAIEEPLGRDRIRDLPQLKESSELPIIVDESLVSLEDAKFLSSEKACDFFNIRISKCGGLSRSLEFGNIAREAGIKIQIGSHVGETSILSAAGRHLAAHWDDVEFLEGSFGTLLLTEDLCAASVRFGHQGWGPVLRGPGLGVAILEDRVRRYATETIDLTY